MTLDVLALAAAVRAGHLRAVDVAQAAIARTGARADLLAVTRCLAERALEEAAAVDAKVARGEDPGPLAGVPYGVKDLFDVAGLATTAGSASRIDAAPATQDAVAVTRLRDAGAVLVATLNMDEFAYGFVTDNAHWGITRNPHDPARFAGGSSGGSATAVAAGLVSFALGSDTNGSIRIPASLCGVFGHKPSHGSLPMDGVFPFVESLDDIGAFARSAADLAAIDAVLRQDSHAPDFTPEPAVLGGWFARNLTTAMQAALDAFGQFPRVSLDRVDKARSAAFLMTGYEGGRFHLPALRDHAMAYDPAVRDRLIAGAAVPEAVYRAALDWRTAFVAQIDRLLDRHGVLIAPVVMGEAPRIDDPVVIVDGERQPARANLGLYTQPISFCGLPVVSAPLPVPGLPLGVQLIGARGSDRALLQWAAGLEARGALASKLEEAC